MKFSPPQGEIAYLTIVWVLLAVVSITLTGVVPLPWYTALLVAILIASAGIWLGVRSFGYAFAALNVIAFVCSILVISGIIAEERSGLSVASVFRTLVPVYCAYVGVRWARSGVKLPSCGG